MNFLNRSEKPKNQNSAAFMIAGIIIGGLGYKLANSFIAESKNNPKMLEMTEQIKRGVRRAIDKANSMIQSSRSTKEDVSEAVKETAAEKSEQFKNKSEDLLQR